MGFTYHFVKFEEKIERRKSGYTKRVDDLMAPLEYICIQSGGIYLGLYESLDPLKNSDHLGQLIRAGNQYMVGNCWVKNTVSLEEGRRFTLIAHLENYGNEMLIERFKAFYGEGNMKTQVPEEKEIKYLGIEK